MEINKLKENLTEKIYNQTRNWLKKSMTCFLGKTEETDNEIICYVEKSKVRKDSNGYKIICLNKNISESLANKYNLNKQVNYVIDGIKFDKTKVVIFGTDNCKVNIKNCRFENGLNVWVSGKCKLEDSYILEPEHLKIEADELTIKDMIIKNQIWNPYGNLLVSLASDKKIEVINSVIGEQDNRTNIEIRNPKELKLINSKIIGYNSVNITSDKTIYDDTSGAMILRTIPKQSSVVIFDGKSSNGKEILNLETEKINQKRQELIKVLKEISEKCKRVNNEVINNLEKELNNQTIAKTLIRK